MPEKTTRCSTRSNTEKIYTKTKNPADLEVNKYMKLKIIICT